MNELSIIIPCVSTVDHLPDFIDELSAYLMNNPSDIDIIVVVNQDVEHTGRLVHYVHTKHPWLKFEILQRSGNAQNFGALVRFAMAYSASRYVVLVSPYGEDDISLIAPMLNIIRKGAQVVQVNRYSSEVDYKKIRLRFRVYQHIYRFLTKILLGFNISDSTYGFKMFDRVFIQALGLSQNGYSICPEITFKAILANGKVEHIPSGIKCDIETDFKLHKEGVGYISLLVKGFFHRIGLLWF